MRIEAKFIIATLLFIMMIHTSSATTVELVNPGKLSTQLNEGEQADYTIKIYGYDNAKSITIETSLISSNNKPIYDFGELNPTMSENRYSSTITINTSDVPKTIQVSISGKVPGAETVNNYGDITITKFRDPKLKYYDIHADEKMIVVEPFELIIGKKKTFSNTMEQITRSELDGIKREIGELFDRGLTSEAQGIAVEINSIKWPNNLSLLGVIKIDNDLWLNIIVIIVLVIGLLIGFLIGTNIDNSDRED